MRTTFGRSRATSRITAFTAARRFGSSRVVLATGRAGDVVVRAVEAGNDRQRDEAPTAREKIHLAQQRPEQQLCVLGRPDHVAVPVDDVVDHLERAHEQERDVGSPAIDEQLPPRP